MISKWLFTALAAAVIFVTTVELGHFSARHPPVAPVLRDPTVTEAGAEPASSTSLTR